jgi:hypothetical protein
MNAEREQSPAKMCETTIGPSFYGALALALLCSAILWVSAIVCYFYAQPTR